MVSLISGTFNFCNNFKFRNVSLLSFKMLMNVRKMPLDVERGSVSMKKVHLNVNVKKDMKRSTRNVKVCYAMSLFLLNVKCL